MLASASTRSRLSRHCLSWARMSPACSGCPCSSREAWPEQTSTRPAPTSSLACTNWNGSCHDHGLTTRRCTMSRAPVRPFVPQDAAIRLTKAVSRVRLVLATVFRPPRVPRVLLAALAAVAFALLLGGVMARPRLERKVRARLEREAAQHDLKLRIESLRVGLWPALRLRGVRLEKAGSWSFATGGIDATL